MCGKKLNKDNIGYINHPYEVDGKYYKLSRGVLAPSRIIMRCKKCHPRTPRHNKGSSYTKLNEVER